MKKLCALMFVLLSTGCGEMESKPVLAVTLNYTGTGAVSASKSIRVDLWTSATDIGTDYSLSTYGGSNYISIKSGEISHTINPNIYYLIAYYDKDGNAKLSSGDSYVIYDAVTYDGSSFSGTPKAVDCSIDQSIPITFDDTNLWP